MHEYAAQSRAELDESRAAVRADADRLREREQGLDRARDEHRLAVAQFRQQLLDWQSKVGDLKDVMSRTESRVDARQGEVAEAAARLDATTLDLARQADDLRRERQQVTERRAEIEGHLSDMREWYRKKLRALASGGGNPPASAPSGPEPALRIAPTPADLEPGDRQLGELLQARGLVDADALSALWAEADRQHRTLRQVLLASGTVTLYQLALIEAGNLDGLVLDRLRVVDRLRVTPRETVYRVFDPTRTDGPTRGTFLLRHLSESEAEDASRPDEFRQRFATARDAAHPNLAATVEVMEIHGRPAALQEWVTGVPGSDWPAGAAVPGVWLKLLTDAAGGLAAGHNAGLIHGRLTADSLVLTDAGEVKLLGLADPPWLVGHASDIEPTFGADLRTLGQIAFAWTQYGPPPTGRKRAPRPKAFPEQLLSVIRRLEADADTPMADTSSGAEPYRTAAELVDDLRRLAIAFPCRSAEWNDLMGQTAEGPTRRSA